VRWSPISACKQGDLATSELVLAAMPSGDSPIADRIAAAQAACGWELAVRRT
jgi:hypothetical protein